MKVRQWEKGKTPLTSPLQYVAGTLVELGIDYFNYIPGAVNLESSYGKALKSFLAGLDEISFTSDNDFKRFVAQQVAPRLFVSSIESLGELSTEISSNVQFQDFMKVASKNMADDLTVRFHAMHTDDDSEEVIRWGQLVFRSLVKNTGTYLFSSTSDIFGTEATTAKLIQSTGVAFMEAIFDQQTGAIKMEQAFQPSGVDMVFRAALGVFAEHPEMLSRTDGIKEIIRDVSKALSTNGFVRPDLVPEVIRLVLEKTAGNLNNLWEIHEADSKNMLVLVVESFLVSLSAKPSNGVWKPTFTNAQLLDMLDYLTDEVVARPAWMDHLHHNQPILSDVLDAVFSVMDILPKEERLQPGIAELLIKLSLRTAATSPAVLDKVDYGTNANEASVLHEAMDVLFSFLFPADKPSRAKASGVLEDSTTYVLTDIITSHPNRQGILAVHSLCSTTNGLDFSKGFNAREADLIVKPSLNLAYHQKTFNPEIGKNYIDQIITAVTLSCRKASLNHPRLIAGIQELVLDKTEQNLHLLQDLEEGQTTHLLVELLDEILPLLNRATEDGQWRPRFNIEQIISFCDELMEMTLADPAWIYEQVEGVALLKLSLETSLEALADIPKKQRPKLDYLMAMIQRNFEAVYQNPVLVQNINMEEPKDKDSILAQTLHALFHAVYPEGMQPKLKRNQIALELQDYLLREIILEEPNAQGLLLVRMLLSPHSGIDLSEGFSPELASNLIASFKDVLTEDVTIEETAPDLTQEIITSISLLFKEAQIEDEVFKQKIITGLEDRYAAETEAGTTNISTNLWGEALKHILNTTYRHLSSPTWPYPKEGTELAQFTLNVLDKVLLFPALIPEQDGFASPIIEILDTSYHLSKRIPLKYQLTAADLLEVIHLNLRAVHFNQRLLAKIILRHEGVRLSLLRRGADMVADHVYQTNGVPRSEKDEIFLELLEFVLLEILVKQPSQKGLEMARLNFI